MLRLALALLLFLAPIGSALALSAAERTEVERLRQYMSGITTLKAGFNQVDSNGKVASGKFWMQRPNRLRFEYDPPVPILVVARASFLVHYDKDLKEATYLDQEDTPAWLLLADEVQFGDDVIIHEVRRKGTLIEVTAEHRGQESEGIITLIFNNSPIELRGWRLTDPSGTTVNVSLTNQQQGMQIDQKLFDFRPTEYD